MQPSFWKAKTLLLFAGPCQIESESHALKTAEALMTKVEGLPLSLVYKSSYDKANRTSLSGKRGIGIDEGLKILEKVKSKTGLPVITDIHTPEEAKAAGEIVDILQTPAFLCRQTDLLLAAGSTGKPVNIKKGQFLHPADMKFAAEKVLSQKTSHVFLCERGTSFGYRDLVVDPRSFIIMKNLGYPVIFDATHSVQNMGGANGASEGDRTFIRPLIRSAVATGVEGLFIECHEDPAKAPSDGASMLPMSDMRTVLEEATRIWEATNA